MSDCLTIIDQIVAAVTCDGDQLIIAAVDPTNPPLRQEAQMSSHDAVPMIASYLYAHYYAFDPELCNPDAFDYLSLLGHRLSDVEFVRSLAKANSGHGFFSNGWQVMAIKGEGNLTVHKQGVTLQAKARHLRPEEIGADIGQSVSLRFPKDSAGASPGFYVAHSDAGPPDSAEVTRVYFNLRSHHAVNFTALLIGRLLSTGLPYSFKILADPERFRRRDSAVLYIRSCDAESIIRLVVAICDVCPHAFDPAVPSFTLRVRDGVGVADDPRTGSLPAVSFGQHRTMLIAKAIKWVVDECSPVSADAVRSAILRSCVEEGVDAARLHLAHIDAPDNLAGLVREAVAS
jgi:hypothetical protein